MRTRRIRPILILVGEEVKLQSVESTMVLADLHLARRLERTEADANRRYVEARARVDPAIGAAWIEVAGAYALFDGVESPLTQSFGLGVFSPAEAAHFEAIEAFFASRRAPTFHEVSPLAEGVLPLLSARAYEPAEVSTVLYRELPSAPVPPPRGPNRDLTVERVGGAEQDLWTRVSADGWGATPELREFILALGRVTAAAEGIHVFGARLGGQPAAAASMMMHAGVALLAGASTVPAARGRGAQAALLAARLQTATAAGCELAMMVAQPGSASQRNAERNGFRVAYTRTKWRRR